ncbi:MAG: phosphatase PAP2 family protein [Candidatus Kariarchaeaceae archaeon]
MLQFINSNTDGNTSFQVLKELIAEINTQRFYEYLRGFTFQIDSSFRKVVRWPWILLHILAITISIPIVVNEIDWSYFKFFAKYRYLQILLFPAVPLGGLLPFLLPPVIYLYSKKEEKPQLEPLAYSLTQAAVVGLIWSSIYKALSGRTGPELFEDFDGNYSQEFAFGILRKGVFDGWPSGHTTIAWAMAVVFYYYRPIEQFRPQFENYEIPTFHKYRKFGFLYAAYIGFGVSTNIHWLSDALAGMLIGITVGRSVSQSYRTNWIGNDANSSLNKAYWIFSIMFVLIIFSILGFDDL